MLVTARAVRVVSGERLLGQDVEANEQAEGFVAVEVVDMAPSLFVEQFQCQQREQRTGGGDHLRVRIPRLSDEPIETEPSQVRQEEEDARDAGVDRAAVREIQCATIGDVRSQGTRSVVAYTGSEGSATPVGEKKGVATPRRQSGRKRLANDFRVEGV
ncbi:hypothetical protein [Singulisphaera acidiphila]|uniref:hypothetical protein n=1 Tax=Singulisphaera acidiphila TaxID=466153 RepID=UPI0002470F31|nr:hypothetical protein [Singulisphaera acidiphila]